MANRYNNRKIIKLEQTLSIGKLLPGMIVTFNYSESNVTDPKPILLFLYNENKLLQGLNLNYINPTKLKKLFSVMDFKKTELDEQENLVSLKETYFRVQIANPKKTSSMNTKRFYSDIISSDNVFKKSYRSYKLSKLTALKVTNIKLKMVGMGED